MKNLMVLALLAVSTACVTPQYTTRQIVSVKADNYFECRAAFKQALQELEKKGYQPGRVNEYSPYWLENDTATSAGTLHLECVKNQNDLTYQLTGMLRAEVGR